MGSSESSKNHLDYLKQDSRAMSINIENELIKRAYIGLCRVDESTIKRWGLGVNYVHASILLCATDSFVSEGIILEYGKYDYEKDERIKYEYDIDGGMRYGKISFSNFKKYQASSALINLDLNKSPLVRFNKLIEEIKNEGSWKKNDYKVTTHNCQHFICEVIQKLKPNFDTIGILPGDNSDLIEGQNIEQIIPSTILHVLNKYKIKEN